ncbi:HalOD1 output domain-containing protein [Halorarius litoreus]|uniref:HalOD1 output domain-containing protein n=1 Tax=Halorarius litoreus TaxID=2962676 RepID=UPI0020CCB994|nr:HalOD1 output domain-containing protein [Halorarius litoreus]
MRAAEPIVHRWDGGTSPSIAIVEAVSAATDTATTDLPPLFEAVDVDALDTLVKSRGKAGAERLTVSFTYAGVAVTVYSDGDIKLDGATSN